MNSVASTVATRESTHGPFDMTARIAQELKGVMRCYDWYALTDCQREALEMMCSKFARILNGNSNFGDHWHDIAGYAQLAEQEVVQDSGQDA